MYSIQQAVVAAQNGEEWGWELLYQEYYAKMLSISLRITNSIPDSKDLVHDSFITAYLKLSQLKATEKFEGWLKSIVIRTCLHAIKNKARHRRLDRTSEFDDITLDDDVLGDIEKKSERLILDNKLYRQLAQLPSTLLSTLMLRYFSSFHSYEKISQILAIPIGTVRSRLNDAKIKLMNNWNQEVALSNDVLLSNKEWNQFYFESYKGLHFHEVEQNRFLKHLGKNVKIFFPDGSLHIGAGAFENVLLEDQKYGSYLKPEEVFSVGNISIIESRHYNSAEYPDHCPSRSIQVIFRKDEKVGQMNFYLQQ